MRPPTRVMSSSSKNGVKVTNLLCLCTGRPRLRSLNSEGNALICSWRMRIFFALSNSSTDGLSTFFQTQVLCNYAEIVAHTP